MIGREFTWYLRRVRVHVGTSGFSYKEWKGSFYPEDLSEKKMLSFYGTKLETVEINASFYRMPAAKTVADWASQVPDAFTFVLKAPQRITHQLRLKNCADTLAYFVEVSKSLGDKRGPFLFQLPPNFKKDVPRLAEFLALVPSDVRAAFEFRNDTWFADDTYEALRARGVALCCADTEKGSTPLVATAGFGYLRLRDADYTEEELGAWRDRILALPWSDAFVYMKHEDEGRGAKMAMMLRGMLGA